VKGDGDVAHPDAVRYCRRLRRALFGSIHPSISNQSLLHRLPLFCQRPPPPLLLRVPGGGAQRRGEQQVVTSPLAVACRIERSLVMFSCEAIICMNKSQALSMEIILQHTLHFCAALKREGEKSLLP